LRPHVLVKGGDWTRETTIGREIVEEAGGEVVIVPYVEGISTTGLIDRIVRSRGGALRRSSPER